MPLGMYCLSNPFLFSSLLPRRHGFCGSQKKTRLMSVAKMTFLWACISVPLSQVSDLWSSCGSLRAFLMSALTASDGHEYNPDLLVRNDHNSFS